jgi:glutaconate CoA-transferase subunit A
VVVVAEEIVESEQIRARPELTVIPGFQVDAIVVEPWAAHPSDSFGYYWRDLEHHQLYGRMSRTPEGLDAYLQEWVHGTSDRRQYLARLGEQRTSELMARVDRWW